MHFSQLFTASLAVVPFVAAHGGIPGAPKIWGLRAHDIGQLKRRGILDGHGSKHAHGHGHGHAPQDSRLSARQGGLDGMCGPTAGGASCDEGYCCSPAGYCGQGEDYCIAPDGLFLYGPANDANVLPSGGSTRSIARPQLGAVPYGGDGIYHCLVPGTVAITYDDGPYLYTQTVLDMFQSYGYKATFFVTGNNNGKGPIDSTSQWAGMINNMIAGGHQVASHTWSHQDLSSLTQAQRYEQMIKNEMAFANIMGKFPTYMRPPYSSCTAASGCGQDMVDLGYVVSYFDLDTDDYNNLAPEKIQVAKNNFNGNVSSTPSTTGDWLAVAHDIHEITATNLTKSMLDELKSLGYKGVTMGECMGDPSTNWYRTANAANRVATTSSFSRPGSSATSTVSGGSSSTVANSASATASLLVSVDGLCGTGVTCIGYDAAIGSCCSQYGYCGNTDGHCGTGCQPAFGVCGISSSSSIVTASSTTSQSTSSTASSTSLSSSATSTSASLSSSVSSSAANPSSTSSRASSSSAVSSSASRSSSASSSASRSSSASSSIALSSTISSSSATRPTSTSSSSSSSSIRASSSSSSTSVPASSSATSTRTSSTLASSSTRVSSSSSASSTQASSSSSTSSNRATSSSSSSTQASSTSIRISTSSAPSSTKISSTSTLMTSTRASSSSSKVSSAPSATPTLTLSTDGKCGSLTKQSCSMGVPFFLITLQESSIYGPCCNQAGRCGYGPGACAAGCQPDYGTCY